MGIYTTRPVKELNLIELKELLRSKQTILSAHALDHLSSGQRKLFKEEDLINTVEKETPRKAYLQENKRYACYYRKSEGYLKIILDIDKTSITIISFMNVLEIPR